MEIIESKIQGNLLQEFTAKYLEEHKELIEHIKETTKKQLLLHNVSQQRELLFAYEEYRHSDSYNLADGYEDVIERFIANNCR